MIRNTVYTLVALCFICSCTGSPNGRATSGVDAGNKHRPGTHCKEGEPDLFCRHGKCHEVECGECDYSHIREADESCEAPNEECRIIGPNNDQGVCLTAGQLHAWPWEVECGFGALECEEDAERCFLGQCHQACTGDLQCEGEGQVCLQEAPSDPVCIAGQKCWEERGEEKCSPAPDKYCREHDDCEGTRKCYDNRCYCTEDKHCDEGEECVSSENSNKNTCYSEEDKGG